MLLSKDKKKGATKGDEVEEREGEKKEEERPLPPLLKTLNIEREQLLRDPQPKLSEAFPSFPFLSLPFPSLQKVFWFCYSVWQWLLLVFWI